MKSSKSDRSKKKLPKVMVKVWEKTVQIVDFLIAHNVPDKVITRIIRILKALCKIAELVKKLRDILGW